MFCSLNSGKTSNIILLSGGKIRWEENQISPCCSQCSSNVFSQWHHFRFYQLVYPRHSSCFRPQTGLMRRPLLVLERWLLDVVGVWRAHKINWSILRSTEYHKGAERWDGRSVKWCDWRSSNQSNKFLLAPLVRSRNIQCNSPCFQMETSHVNVALRVINKMFTHVKTELIYSGLIHLFIYWLFKTESLREK